MDAYTSSRLKKEDMKTGIELIAKERREQIEKHNRTVEYDIQHNKYRQLSIAAQSLLEKFIEYRVKPTSEWNDKIWDKMINADYIKRLTIAGALIAAEIDRINELNKQNEKDKI